MERTDDGSNSDDDIPQLSAATLDVLREIQQRQQESLDDSISPFQNDLDYTFPEDWQMSQFWYDSVTSEKLAEIVKILAGSSGKIACVSCPSVFRACGSSPNVHLYEYDRRFERFGDSYFFYDYNQPLEISDESVSSYTVVIADPPFLSEECLEKVSVTVKKLIQPNGKIILCTGAVMEEKAAELLSLHKTSFVPTHNKNLGNTFACFTNFSWDDIYNQKIE